MCKRCWLIWSAACQVAAWLGAVWTTASSAEHVLCNTQSQSTLKQKTCFYNPTVQILTVLYMFIKMSKKYALLVCWENIFSNGKKPHKNIYCIPVVRPLCLVLGFLFLELWAVFLKSGFGGGFFWRKVGEPWCVKSVLSLVGHVFDSSDLTGMFFLCESLDSLCIFAPPCPDMQCAGFDWQISW